MHIKWIRARRLRNEGTDAERRLWHHLRQRQLAGHKFRRQYPLAGYIVDFVCVPARLVIELDGGQHLDALDYDRRRSGILAREGYRVLRFWNDDVLLRTADVLGEIFRALEERSKATPPQPSPTL
ncbi:endonuclease domain-containing protein [Rhodanobacter ginsengiterrae]|uniref:endonuclease domain-containing protein n=1 Tax=Rhodanobacter ginsengiterrae TaxID=2008451 RepID=UPI003CEE2BBC